jgi:MYXO-CTERM domain-containing protein
MTHKLSVLSCVCTSLFLSSLASAEVVFTDAVGDDANGNSNLDLTSLTISNDDSVLTIAVSVNDLHSDWGKHMLFFETGADGHQGTSNPWFRNVSHYGNKISHFVGSYLDGGGGASLHQYDSGADNWGDNTNISKSIDWGNNTFTYEIELSLLGIGIGDTIRFDMTSTGGGNGDPVTDMFSSGSAGTWGSGSSLGTDLMEYTTVPAPGALTLLGAAGLVARRRRA